MPWEVDPVNPMALWNPEVGGFGGEVDFDSKSEDVELEQYARDAAMPDDNSGPDGGRDARAYSEGADGEHRHMASLGYGAEYEGGEVSDDEGEEVWIPELGKQVRAGDVIESAGVTLVAADHRDDSSAQEESVDGADGNVAGGSVRTGPESGGGDSTGEAVFDAGVEEFEFVVIRGIECALHKPSRRLLAPDGNEIGVLDEGSGAVRCSRKKHARSPFLSLPPEPETPAQEVEELGQELRQEGVAVATGQEQRRRGVIKEGRVSGGSERVASVDGEDAVRGRLRQRVEASVAALVAGRRKQQSAFAKGGFLTFADEELPDLAVMDGVFRYSANDKTWGGKAGLLRQFVGADVGAPSVARAIAEKEGAAEGLGSRVIEKVLAGDVVKSATEDLADDVWEVFNAANVSAPVEAGGEDGGGIGGAEKADQEADPGEVPDRKGLERTRGASTPEGGPGAGGVDTRGDAGGPIAGGEGRREGGGAGEAEGGKKGMLVYERSLRKKLRQVGWWSVWVGRQGGG